MKAVYLAQEQGSTA